MSVNVVPQKSDPASTTVEDAVYRDFYFVSKSDQAQSSSQYVQ